MVQYNQKNTMRMVITDNDFVAIKFDSTLLRGSGVPPSTLGISGDYYLDRVSGYLYVKSRNTWLIETNLKGDAGTSSYTYIAYASDNTGSNFSTTPGNGLDFIAILVSAIKLTDPQQQDFSGLWTLYKSAGSNETIDATVTEPLTAGSFVNIYGTNGTLYTKNANAINDSSPCSGFVLQDYIIGDQAVVYISGINNLLSNLITDSTYYLDITKGSISQTMPSNSGNIIQYIGVAISSMSLQLQLQEIINVG